LPSDSPSSSAPSPADPSLARHPFCSGPVSVSAPGRFRVRQLRQLVPRSVHGNCRKRTLGRLGAGRLDARAGDQQPPVRIPRAGSWNCTNSSVRRACITSLRTARLVFELTAGPIVLLRKLVADLRCSVGAEADGVPAADPRRSIWVAWSAAPGPIDAGSNRSRRWTAASYWVGGSKSVCRSLPRRPEAQASRSSSSRLAVYAGVLAEGPCEEQLLPATPSPDSPRGPTDLPSDCVALPRWRGGLPHTKGSRRRAKTLRQLAS
jgi:hypothetical protein